MSSIRGRSTQDHPVQPSKKLPGLPPEVINRIIIQHALGDSFIFVYKPTDYEYDASEPQLQSVVATFSKVSHVFATSVLDHLNVYIELCEADLRQAKQELYGEQVDDDQQERDRVDLTSPGEYRLFAKVDKVNNMIGALVTLRDSTHKVIVEDRKRALCKEVRSLKAEIQELRRDMVNLKKENTELRKGLGAETFDPERRPY